MSFEQLAALMTGDHWRVGLLLFVVVASLLIYLIELGLVWMKLHQPDDMEDE